MGLYTQLADLAEWIPNETAINRVLPKQLWIIPTSEEMGIFRALIMSYLISSSRLDVYKYLRYRLTVKVGCSEKITGKKQFKVRDNVLLYNPFCNSNRLFFSKLVDRKVLAKFKEYLNDFFKNEDENCENSNISGILTAASSMLQCSIFLYKSNDNNLKSLEIYQAEILTPSSARELYIFCGEKDHNLKSTFGYGITEDNAFHLRESALRQFIKPSDWYIYGGNYYVTFEKEIFLENQFLISLLQSPNSHLFKKIFNFPYSAMKLIEAGFNTNPLMTDGNGLSAFFYAFKKGDISLIILLYNYAANNFYLTEDTCTKQQTNILTALKCIKKTLENDESRSTSFSSLENKNIAVQFHLQLMYFNDCQIKMISNMIDSENINSDNVKSRQLIIAMIDKYEEYFYINGIKGSSTIEDKFKNYLDFNIYYDFLDNYFTFLIFGNILSLASFLNDTVIRSYFSTIVSFFLLTRSKDKEENETPIQMNSSEINYAKNFCMYIPLCFRENCLKNALKLKFELENVKDRTGYDVEQNFSHHQPEISNILITLKLRYYFVFRRGDCGMYERTLDLERALQVFGELIQNETLTKCPIKYFLCSFLQDGTEHKLVLIRNHLSYLKSNYIQGRMCMEKNDYRNYMKLDSEFGILTEVFSCIEITQLHKLEEIMFEKGINEANETFGIAISSLEEEKTLRAQKRKETYRLKRFTFVLLAKNMLNYIEQTLTKKDTADSSSEEKTEIVMNQTAALIHLLEYMVDCCEDIERDILQCELKSFRDILSQIKAGDLAILPLLSKSYKTLSKLKSDKIPWIYEKIDELTYNSFNENESDIIMNKITKFLEKSKEAKDFCLEKLGINNAYVLWRLREIFATKKNRRLIEIFIEEGFIQEAKKRLEEIQEFSPESIFKPEHHTTDTILSMSTRDDQRLLLLKLSFKAGLRKKIHRLVNQKIYFLINRIGKLKTILIEEDKYICYLWNLRNKNKTVNKDLKRCVRQRYLSTYDIRAATEMLFFDCKSILSNEGNEGYWIKFDSFFTGINLRDCMLHRSPIVYGVENILEPEDSASSLIDNILELIDDKESLIALLKLCIMQKESSLNDFVKSIKDGDNSQAIYNISSRKDPKISKRDRKLQRQKQFQKVVKSSERWERYAELLPLMK